MKLVVAPDSFKQCLSSTQVCQAIVEGLRRVWPGPDVRIEAVPMSDGGEGLVEALLAARGGRKHPTTVRGPLGQPVEAFVGLLEDGQTAVIEMASASGLGLIDPQQRDPLRTTTYGTGQLILGALDWQVRRIIVGVGGSATVDGGVGCAQALGVRFFGPDGRVLPDGLGGGDLQRVGRIDASGRDRRLEGVELVVACDVDNRLCGPQGAAAVYGPQKGATPQMVEQLEAGLAHLAGLIERDLGRQVAEMPGAGAAGGLAAGLVGFCGARLRPGVELVMEATGLQQRLVGCDLVITGEGRLDAQSLMGKVISGVGRVARQAGVPVVALVGSVGEGAEAAGQYLDAWLCIQDGPRDLPTAIRRARELLRDAAANLAGIWSAASR
ncbi:MAG: glycerate kinase [Phycisphaerae bacterium]